MRGNLFRSKDNSKGAHLEVRWNLFQNFAVLKQIWFYDKIRPIGVSNLLFQNEVFYDLWLCANFHQKTAGTKLLVLGALHFADLLL